MKRYVVLALAVGFLVGADDPKKDKGKKGTKGLVGTWQVVSATEGGNANDKMKGRLVVFEDYTVTVKAEKGDMKATYQADPKKKTIDLTPTEGKNKDKTILGIYELKKDRLTICYAHPDKDRPKDFTAGKGSGNVLVVLKRAKDKGDKNEKKLASVAGTVTLDGKPLAKATVVFVPVKKGAQKAMGTTNEDGSFELTTGGNKKGAPAGEYKVVVTKKVGGKSVLRNEYSSEKTTPLTVTVQEGRNQFDLQLKSR
jgi:uncharacterized protein (TIGR03067 family)